MQPKGIASSSMKQCINTCSSTEAEIVSCNDFLNKMIWAKNFLECQGVPVKQNFLAEDNKSGMILEEKWQAALGK